MKKKRIISLILSLCMVLTICLPTMAASSYTYSGKCGSNLTWTYSLLNQTLTISGTGDMYNYEIGDTIATTSGTSEIWKDVPPTAIEKVIIEEGVTSIGDNAFGNLQYMSSITLPSTIKSIGKYAFTRCQRLTTINLVDLGTWSEIIINGTYSHPAEFSKGSLYYNSEKATDIEIPQGTQKITKYSYYYFSNIKTVKIPKTVKSIDKYVFNQNTTLNVYKNSYAYNYAIQNNFSYTLLDGKEFTGLSFDNATYTYDGKEREIKVAGDLPAGANVDYSNNKATNAGTYNATAKITCKGYEDLTLNATLKINPAEISVKADDKKIIKGASVPTLTYTADTLFGEDKFSGALATKADGKTVGTFDITQGTLTAGDNYKINFTKGTLTVSDKTPQTADVSVVSEKTYGDGSFTVSVTNDSVPSLGNFTFESSNTDVAEITAEGVATIKNAGETNITVKRDGNDTYASFEKTQKLVVKKVPVTVTADAKTKKVGTADPELTYTYTGALVGTDTFAGKLTRQQGEEIGKYDILQGTLALGDNYDITYNKAVFEILDKTPQTITVADFGEKTYGDGEFAISVTPDSASNLKNFTYSSDNEAVATVSADGKITIKGAGEANIAVTEAGNDEYAKTTVTKKLTVNKKPVTVTSINTVDKTAVLAGISDADKDKAMLDFDKITIEIGDAIDETTSNAVLKNFVLKGDKAANYNVTTESLETTIANENVVTVEIKADNGTVSGAAKYLKGAQVTVAATPNSGYNFSGWYNGETVVSTSAEYTFKAESDITLTAKFARRSSGGGGGGSSVSSCTVKFETNGGSKVSSQSVSKNSTVKEPTAPTKDGFEFAGWYADKELKTKYDFSDKVTKSITLYAAWTEKKAETTDPADKPSTPETKGKFTDVNDSDWFGENVKYVFENGLMSGVSENKFAPNDNLTRAMLVTILYRAQGEPEVNKIVPFADVAADSYYANAVIWAQQNGIVSGVSENEFAPDTNITREQIAAIMFRYAKAKGYDVSVGESTNILSYADAEKVSEYATEAVQYAVGSGLLNGKSETTLNPGDTATRAEIAAILQRFIEGNK